MDDFVSYLVTIRDPLSGEEYTIGQIKHKAGQQEHFDVGLLYLTIQLPYRGKCDYDSDLQWHLFQQVEEDRVLEFLQYCACNGLGKFKSIKFEGTHFLPGILKMAAGLTNHLILAKVDVKDIRNLFSRPDSGEDSWLKGVKILEYDGYHASHNNNEFSTELNVTSAILKGLKDIQGLKYMPPLDKLSLSFTHVEFQDLQEAFCVQGSDCCQAKMLELQCTDLVGSNNGSGYKNDFVTELHWHGIKNGRGKPQKFLAPMVGLFSKLEILKLHHCMMTDLKPLYPYLTGPNATIEDLSVERNEIGLLGMMDFLPHLDGMTSLKTVSMGDNKVGGQEPINDERFLFETFHNAVSQDEVRIEKFTVSKSFDESILPKTWVVFAKHHREFFFRKYSFVWPENLDSQVREDIFSLIQEYCEDIYAPPRGDTQTTQTNEQGSDDTTRDDDDGNGAGGTENTQTNNEATLYDYWNNIYARDPRDGGDNNGGDNNGGPQTLGPCGLCKKLGENGTVCEYCVRENLCFVKGLTIHGLQGPQPITECSGVCEEVFGENGTECKHCHSIFGKESRVPRHVIME